MKQVVKPCKYSAPISDFSRATVQDCYLRGCNKSGHFIHGPLPLQIGSTFSLIRVDSLVVSYKGRLSFASSRSIRLGEDHYLCVLGDSTHWQHGLWNNSLHSLHGRINRQLVQAAYDDEFRSSRSIALGLYRRYKSVLESGFTDNLNEFINAGVTAYSVGCTAEGLRKELLSVGEVEGDFEGSTGNIGLKSKLKAEEIEECILWLSILFITILCTPQPTIVRWSPTPPVSADTQLQWRGFCALIANAYYKRGMAWLPVKTLQMEQLAVAGYAEEPSLVADRMRLVFTTLELVSPQWPRR